MSPLRQVLANFSVLMAGRAVAALMSIAAVTLAARILGAREFGVLVLVHTTAMVTRGLLNFKPSDTVVRFGVSLYDEGDRRGFSSLLRFTTALDVVTAVASALVLLLLVAWAGPMIGLPDSLRGPSALYALALLAAGTGSAKGILRVTGRFDAISVQQTVGPAVRLLGIAVAYRFDAGLDAYVLVWAAAMLAEFAYLNFRGLRELRAKGLRLEMPRLSEAKSFPGIWRFVRTLYWQSNLELAQRHGLILLAGGMLGPTGAGMLRIAREFADVLAKPVVVVRQVVFPDLERLWRDGDQNFRGLYLRLGAVSTAVAVVVVGIVAIFGAEVLEALVGHDYVYGAGLLTWLMLAAAIDLSGAALRPAAYVIGSAAGALRVQVFGAVINIGLFGLLVPGVGLVGAGLAAVTGSAAILAMMVWLVASPSR